MDSQTDDVRRTELETLEAIFPEIHYPVDTDSFTFEIELPVQPAAPVTVNFPAATVNDPAATAAVGPSNGTAEIDSLQVSHLPALSLRITLPDGYPAESPPTVQICTHPQWLPSETLKELENDGSRLWEEMGRDMVAYTYIDHVQRAADDVFGAINAEATLEVDSRHKLAVLDHDIKAKKAAFERETFDCGVCLDPKKGSKCHKMLDCGHIFCLQCLRDFYDDAIQEGNLAAVRCLTPNCAKDRANAHSGNGKKSRRPKTSISPSELLQIGLSEDAVKRCVTLKYKTELEADKNTIYCPRRWCGGAARSKKHRKPAGLEFVETSDHESDQDEDSEPEEELDEEQGQDKTEVAKTVNPADLLAVCEDCGLAFCSRCFQSWHGEFVRCAPKRDKDELTEEEKASLEYVKLHTSPCPTCGAPAQKTHGCNHMICSRCDTHFCYLCSSWLDPTNPYRHYNQTPGGKVTSCYMRLWELEDGDGDVMGLGFMGGQRPPVNRAPAREEVVEEIGRPQEERNNRRNNERLRDQQLDEHGRPVAVAREAPLVLRLMDQPRDAQPDPPAPPQAQHNAGRGQNPPQGGRGAQRGGQAARGRGERGGARAPRGRVRNRPARGAVHNADGDGDTGLDAAQEAWVRRFVQMALMDAEDEIEDDEDDINDLIFRIR